MSRTNIVAQTLPGAYPALPLAGGSVTLTEVPADVGNGNITPIVESKTVVLAHNINVAAKTITFTSAVDSFNRTGDITSYSIGAGKIAAFGPFKSGGWNNSGLEIDANHADVLLAVITLP